MPPSEDHGGERPPEDDPGDDHRHHEHRSVRREDPCDQQCFRLSQHVVVRNGKGNSIGLVIGNVPIAQHGSRQSLFHEY